MRVNVRVADIGGEEESVTRTVQGNSPPSVGVPLIWPPALRVSPSGSRPEAIVQE